MHSLLSSSCSSYASSPPLNNTQKPEEKVGLPVSGSSAMSKACADCLTRANHDGEQCPLLVAIAAGRERVGCPNPATSVARVKARCVFLRVQGRWLHYRLLLQPEWCLRWVSMHACVYLPTDEHPCQVFLFKKENIDNSLQNALAFLVSSSLPAAMATKKGHCSTLWSPLVKQAAQALLVADDP